MSSSRSAAKTSTRGPIRADDVLPFGQFLILGLQHTFTMFGATVLVPILTGLSVSVALFTAGIGTLWFHLVTGRRVPIFLGSSFAFIAPVALVVKIWVFSCTGWNNSCRFDILYNCTARLFPWG